MADGAALDRAALRQRCPACGEARLENGAWSLATSEVHLAVPALLAHWRAAGAALSQLTTHSATLEDVFVALDRKAPARCVTAAAPIHRSSS